MSSMVFSMLGWGEAAVRGRLAVRCVRSVAQTYLRPKLGHVFLFFDVLGSIFGLPDLSSWENI